MAHPRDKIISRDEFRSTVATNIRELREKKHLPLVFFADWLALSVDEYHDYESAVRDIPVYHLSIIAMLLGVSVSDLLPREPMAGARTRSRTETELLKAFRQAPLSVREIILGLLKDSGVR